MSYNTYGTNSGHITLASVLSLLSLGIVFTLRSGFWKRVALHDQILGKANNSDRYDVVHGNTGSTLSALRPSGTAIINGNKYEVHSSGEFIDSNQEVEVTQINNHKIFVKPKT
jgi:membrane-bound serine protease (ClpP class)